MVLGKTGGKLFGQKRIRVVNGWVFKMTAYEENIFKIVKIVSERSTCIRRSFGAIILKDNNIISSGFNGAPSKCFHCEQVGCLRTKLKVPSGERHEICCSGDTLIHATLGDRTIKQLAEEFKDKEIDVFCLKANSALGIGKANNIRLTKNRARIYEIIFDDGSKIKLTYEHEILMRDGEYKKVSALKIGDSVMPFNYFHTDKNYLCIFPKINGKSIGAHKFVYEESTGEKLKNNEIIHHKDFNSLNNNISNLEKRDKIEHFLWHSQNFSGDNNPMRRLPGLRKKQSKRMVGDNNPMKGKKPWNIGLTKKIDVRVASLAIKGSSTLKRRYSTGELKSHPSYWNKNLTKETDDRIAKWAAERKGKKYIRHKQSNKPRNLKPRDIRFCNNCRKEFIVISTSKRKYCNRECAIFCNLIKGGEKTRFKSNINFNHKIISICFAGVEDVYNMEVEKYHNFAANNIFIHNCRGAHAEVNAIVQAAKHGIGIKGASIFTNMIPCGYCAKAIINSGILEVHCLSDDYPDKLGETLLKEANIKIIIHKI